MRKIRRLYKSALFPVRKVPLEGWFKILSSVFGKNSNSRMDRPIDTVTGAKGASSRRTTTALSARPAICRRDAISKIRKNSDKLFDIIVDVLSLLTL